MVDRFYATVYKSFCRLAGAARPAQNEFFEEPTPSTLLPDHDAHQLCADHDVQALRFGARYRGAIVFGFLLGWLAVGLALLPLSELIRIKSFSANAWVCTVLEILCIALIFWQHLYGRDASHNNDRPSKLFKALGFQHINQSWRRNWTLHRLLAEQYRYAPLLLGFPGGPMNATDSLFGSHPSNQAFLKWYQIEYRKMQVMPVSADSLPSYRVQLMATIAQQSTYHALAADKNKRLVHRMHHVADACFWYTIVACTAHFFWHANTLNVLTAFLPATAATCHAVLAAGEFEKLKVQSSELHAWLSQLLESLQEQLVAQPQVSSTQALEVLAQQVRSFHSMVIHEAAGWHLSLRDKDVGKA
jgi:hypothetical protein